MRVVLKKTVWEMQRTEFNKFLKVAKKHVKTGIYAIEKNGICEMLNERYDSAEKLLQHVNDYEQQGFKVYYNK